MYFNAFFYFTLIYMVNDRKNFQICLMYLFPDVPKIMPSGITIATLGDTVILQCTVDSYPAPKMMFWRDPKGREAVIEGGKYSTNTVEWKTVRFIIIFILSLLVFIEI